MLVHKPCSCYTNHGMFIALTEILFHPWGHDMGREGFNLFPLFGSVFKTNTEYLPSRTVALAEVRKTKAHV